MRATFLFLILMLKLWKCKSVTYCMCRLCHWNDNILLFFWEKKWIKFLHLFAVFLARSWISWPNNQPQNLLFILWNIKVTMSLYFYLYVLDKVICLMEEEFFLMALHELNTWFTFEQQQTKNIYISKCPFSGTTCVIMPHII